MKQLVFFMALITTCLTSSSCSKEEIKKIKADCNKMKCECEGVCECSDSCSCKTKP